MTAQDHAKNLAGYAALAMFGMAGTPVVTWQSNPLLFLVFPSLIAAGLVGAFVYLVGSFLPTLMNEVRTAGYAELPQIAPQTKQDEPQGEVEEISRNPTSAQSRPSQVPVREVRQAEYVTQAEPMAAAANYPQWIRDFDLPPHIKRQWVVELWQARDRGQLRKVSANKVSLVTSADRTKYDADGNSEAALLVSWLIDNYFVTSSGKNNQYEWNGKGRVHFPSPTKELAHQ